MSPVEATELLAGVLATPSDAMDREGCNRRLRDIARLRSVLGAAELRATRRLKELAEQGRSERPEHALGTAGGQSAAGAENAVDREEAAGSLPGFETALGEGEVVPEHLDALSMALKMLAMHPELVEKFKEHEEELLAHATTEGVDAFRKRCRRFAKDLIGRADLEAGRKERERQRKRANVRTWRDKTTGMFHLHAELDPERGAIVDRHLQLELARLKAQDQATGGEPLPFMQLKVDALVSAISTTGEGSPGRAEIVAHVDWNWLRGKVAEAVRNGSLVGVTEEHVNALLDGRLTPDGVLCETADGFPLSVETVRRWACDADILPAVMDSDGIVKDMGRGERTATRGQRNRLLTMHATCIGPECRVPFSKCHIHHVIFWGDLGRTDEDILVPACSRHHHDLHEGGHRIEFTPDRQLTWYGPDGAVLWSGSTVDRRDHPNVA